MTVVLILVLVASIAVGVWDLVSSESRALFGAALTCEAGLLLGAILQLFIPGGFVVGATGGLVGGFAAFRQSTRDSVATVHSLALSQDNDSLRLLELHDHLDSLDSSLRPVYRVAGGMVLALLAAALVSMVVLGLMDDAWTYLLVGSLAAFLPLAHLMRILVQGEERRALGEAISEERLVVETGGPDDGSMEGVSP